jgi:hypothetical protein
MLFDFILITTVEGREYLLTFGEYVDNEPPPYSVARPVSQVEAETWRAKRMAVCV